MSPRPYHSPGRTAAAEQTRGRIVAAARAVIAAPEGIPAFTVEAVAKAAGVSRMTVYHQFGSKSKLIEALFDDLAARGLVSGLREAFTTADPLAALDRMVEAFAAFWTSDRLVIRRVRALAQLDPELGPSIAERDRWRRAAIGRALARLAAAHPLPGDLAAHVDALAALLGFAHFDDLAEDERTPAEVAPVVRAQVHRYLGLDAGATRRP